VQPIGKDCPEITARFSDPAGNILGIYQDQIKNYDNKKNLRHLVEKMQN